MNTILFYLVYSLFILSLLFLLWTFIGYPLFLLLITRLIRRKHTIKEDFRPKVSLMIMTYNEAKVIEKKLRNSLELDYPKDKLEIMVVDSASTDGTQDIVKMFSDKGIKLVAQDKREGKASAINFGMKHAYGDIIVITDANAMMERDAIKKIVRHFADSKVGGVCGRFEARDLHNTSVSAGGSLYWKIERFLRTYESALDSVIHMSGEITAFRRGVIEGADISCLSEDFDMAVRIRKAGYYIIYEKDAIAYEPAPDNVTDLKIQKKRITIGTLQVLLKHWKMLFNPKYGWYGFLILPSHKLFQIMTPFFLLILFMSSFFIYLIHPNILILTILLIQVLFYIVSLLSFIPLKFFQKNPIFIFAKYFILTNYILLLGWIDFIRKRRIVTWTKIESSRNI